MPVHVSKIEPGVLLRFVGPYREGEDKEFMAFDEEKEKEKGPVFRVEKKDRESIVLSPLSDPEKWMRCPVRSGFVERFVVYLKAHDDIDRDKAERKREMEDFKEKFGDRIEDFNQRQLTPADKEEIEKMREIRQKLHEIRGRKRQEGRQDGDQRGDDGSQPPTGGSEG